MSLIKPYNYEQFSVFDIENYLKEQGFEMEYVFYKSNTLKLHIKDTVVYVDFPLVDTINKWIFAEIRFENYPPSALAEKSKKIYQKLSRRFGVKKGEQPKNIKDAEKVQEYLRIHKKM